MDKGEIVKFGDLQIGDYFSDNNRQKCRKIPPFEISLPEQSPITYNAFYIQSNAPISLNPDDEFIFIKHSTWVEEEKYGFSTTIEEAELEHQLDFFSDYLESMDSILSSWAKETDPYNDVFSQQKIYDFLSLLRSSFFVSLYSYLESKLSNECRNSQQNDLNIKISLDDIQGAGIRRAKTYLTKVLDTSFPFDTDPHWKQIHWYNKIRNCIVHNESKIANKELKKFIDSSKNISYERAFGADYIILGDNFCAEALSTISSFLRSLLYYRQADKIS